MVTQRLDQVATFGRKLLDAANPPPSRVQQQGIKSRRTQLGAYYANLEAYHEGQSAAFRDAWMRSRGFGSLPVNVRSISSIAPAVAQWWSDNLFGTAWTPDGLPTADGQANAIDYDNDTPEEVRLAVQQAITWGGNIIDSIRDACPKLGNGLIEIVEHVSEDGPRGNKVFPDYVHPANVVEVNFNERGDITSYRLAIPMTDDTGQPYLRGKLVTKTEIVTFRDEHEHSFDGVPSRQPNSFEFVPAAWIGHQPVEGGSYFGLPAIHYGMATVNAYQSQLSDIADYISRLVRQPVLLSTAEPKRMIEYLVAVKQSQMTDRSEGELVSQWHESKARSDRETINYQPAPKDTTATNVMSNLGLGDADPHIARTWEELETIFPEVVLDRKLLDQQQVTGPGARFLVSAVQTKLNRRASTYDRAIVKIGQMCCAIAGELIDQGAWGLPSQLTRQQQKFLPFDLRSYEQGDLDFGIQPRVLLKPTIGELADEATKLERLSTPMGLRHVGFSDDQIYGFDPDTGESLAPDPEFRPGILQGANDGTAAAAAIGDALSRSFNAGIVTP